MKSLKQNSSNTFAFKGYILLSNEITPGELREHKRGIVENLGFHVRLRVSRLVTSRIYMHVYVYIYVESDATAGDAQRRTLT